MTAIRPTPVPASRDERWLWLFFAGAWLLHCGFSLVGWDNTLLSRFQFRQVQTAMATLFFSGSGLGLNYELPLFGPPWSAPLELPVYQAAVAWFAHWTGMALDPAGRLVSWLFFQLSLPAFYLLLGSLGLRASHRFLCLALLVTSPLYLFFSRFFLMESTVFCFALWFLAAFARWLTGRKPGWLVIASLAGALAATIKPPTIVVFSVAAGLFALWHWWQETGPGRRTPGSISGVALRSALAFLVPVAAGLAWQIHTGAVRARNPETAFLDVMFGYFSFGDLTQRLSADYWRRTIDVWTSGVLSEGGLVLGVFLFARAGRTVRPLVLGCFAAFMSGQLIFSNLYYVHDYYFYANGVFLLLALGLLLATLFEDAIMPRWSRWGLPALIILLQFVTYGRTYLPAQRANTAVPELPRVIQDLTHPDDMIVILGQDWDAAIPYYAQRRALMLRAGRERDPADIERSIARLDPAKVGAVLLFGHLRSDSTFVAQTMARLKLGPTPLLLSQEQQVGVWFPLSRHAEVKDKLPAHTYATLDLVPDRPPAGQAYTVGRREISQLRAFAMFARRPIRATSLAGFSTSVVDNHTVLNTHAPTELVFRAPDAHARTISALFGIHDGAFTDSKGKTDGVEFTVVHRAPDGREKTLFSRLLDPANNADDQGLQRLEVRLEDISGGEIHFRTLPGPRNNASYDWAYFGQIEFH